LSYASSGIGAASHLGMELLKYMAGVDMVHVPYKGIAQAVPDLLAGQIQLTFSISITATPLIKNGKVKALAITSLQRSKTFPDLPTVSESGIPDFKLTTDYSIYAPAGTPTQTIDFINKSAAEIMESAEMKKRLDADGSEAAPPNTPADFQKMIERDIVLMDKFIKASGFKGE
jgi:tripartite-type tricarboxylate transporter receptor subunit TctC